MKLLESNKTTNVIAGLTLVGMIALGVLQYCGSSAESVTKCMGDVSAERKVIYEAFDHVMLRCAYYTKGLENVTRQNVDDHLVGYRRSLEGFLTAHNCSGETANLIQTAMNQIDQIVSDLNSAKSLHLNDLHETAKKIKDEDHFSKCCN